jgi:hypothetical protein
VPPRSDPNRQKPWRTDARVKEFTERATLVTAQAA